MSHFWTIGPTAAALGLRAIGFSPREAERLVALKIRYERRRLGEFPEPDQRLVFVRWLVTHGLLTDWPAE